MWIDVVVEKKVKKCGAYLYLYSDSAYCSLIENLVIC